MPDKDRTTNAKDERPTSDDHAGRPSLTAAPPRWRDRWPEALRPARSQSAEADRGQPNRRFCM